MDVCTLDDEDPSIDLQFAHDPDHARGRRDGDRDHIAFVACRIEVEQLEVIFGPAHTGRYTRPAYYFQHSGEAGYFLSGSTVKVHVSSCWVALARPWHASRAAI